MEVSQKRIHDNSVAIVPTQVGCSGVQVRILSGNQNQEFFFVLRSTHGDCLISLFLKTKFERNSFLEYNHVTISFLFFIGKHWNNDKP